MPPNLSYYKSNPLHNATRKKNTGNGKKTGNRNNTVRPTLKRNNRGRRNLSHNVRIAHMTNEKLIDANNRHEGNLREKKKTYRLHFKKKKNYHGTAAREGLGNTHMKEYRERLEKMSPEELIAHRKEEIEVNNELAAKRTSEENIAKHRKNMLKGLRV